MRYTRKLFLLCATALAVLAMSASSVSANVEVLDEGTDAHCDPCVIHATSTSNIDLISHVVVPGEIVASRCTSEFEAEIYEHGAGHIYNQFLGDASCTTAPCPSTEWPFNLNEDKSTHAEKDNYILLLRPCGHCDHVHRSIRSRLIHTRH